MRETKTAKPQSGTIKERYKAGKALRAGTPRAALAAVTLQKKRDPLAILSDGDSTRIPELLPIRAERMAVSAFAFYRGSAALMADDLRGAMMPGISVQSCGDCHLMNFGAFGTPEGNVLFDINDFDETYPGIDFTVDLRRLVASVALAAIDAGFSRKKAHRLAASAACSYRVFMAGLAILSPLAIWGVKMDLNREIEAFSNEALQRKVARALLKTEKKLLDDDSFPKLAATNASGTAKIADRPPLIYHFDAIADTHQRIDAPAAFAEYQHTLLADRRLLLSRYRLEDVAFKVVGVGSVGTFCAIGLFVSAEGTPLFLQIKEAQRSVLEKLGQVSASMTSQGQRVVDGQRIMQAASDAFLGWTDDTAYGRDLYVRHLKNRRLGSVGELMADDALMAYGQLCARTLARAHARSGDAAMITGYLGNSDQADQALADFAIAYADVTAQDYAKFVTSLPKNATGSN